MINKAAFATVLVKIQLLVFFDNDLNICLCVWHPEVSFREPLVSFPSSSGCCWTLVMIHFGDVMNSSRISANSTDTSLPPAGSGVGEDLGGRGVESAKGAPTTIEVLSRAARSAICADRAALVSAKRFIHSVFEFGAAPPMCFETRDWSTANVDVANEPTSGMLGSMLPERCDGGGGNSFEGLDFVRLGRGEGTGVLGVAAARGLLGRGLGVGRSIARSQGSQVRLLR